MQTCYLAVDIGASSGRHIIGTVEHGVMALHEVYRFENRLIEKNGHLCWDMEGLVQNVIEGLKAAHDAGYTPTTVGIDTWAVDFLLLDADGTPIGDPVAYRDGRTAAMREELEPILPFTKLYARTGIQYQSFNTVYQLCALKKEHPEQLAAAEHFLMVPDYLNYRLTGVMANEYTNASTTALVGAISKDWDDEIINRLGLPRKIFGRISTPGTKLGNLSSAVKDYVGFDCTVVLPATHDTGSAFLAVPARDDKAVYLSSGTWSLLGVENKDPITTPASMQANFTNEGGYEYRYRYLKNIMGLWMIQSIRRELNGVSYVEGKDTHQQTDEDELPPFTHEAIEWGFPDLIAHAKEADSFEAHVNVNDDRFLAPDSMIDEIRRACFETGQDVPQTVGQLMRCVYVSLSSCYAESIAEMPSLTGRTYTSINIVGGGCQDAYLNELTTRACGIPVFAGPVEGTSLGNLAVQMIADGAFPDLQSVRDAIATSFDVKRFE